MKSTINRSSAGLAAGLYFFMNPLPVVAEESYLQDWHIYGSNSVRASVYSADGPGINSPYPFEGDMYYNELNLYFDQSDSNYSRWRGEISGVYNLNDDYRSTDFGVVPERLNLTREDGTGNVPYRAELGDFFTYFSYLTQQTSIKGAQLELQPGFATSNYQHSVVLFSGANESNWRDLTLQDDYSNGVSWLMTNRQDGSLSFNFVHNYRDNSFKAGTLDRNQFVFSAAGEKPFSSWGQDFVFEGEAAWFSGDHNGSVSNASGQDADDPAYFMQLSGNSRALPWDYQFRYQYYGQDFQPRGAVVTADRRSYEAFSNWRFATGVLMRVRGQLFEDAFETTNRLSTRTYGINFTGPLLYFALPDVSGSADFFIQNRDNEAKTTNQLSQNFTASLSKPLPRGWNGRLSLFVQNLSDTTTANADAFTRQISFSADHAFNFFGANGYITPGIFYRALRKGSTHSDDWDPTLAISLVKGNHTLRMDYGGLFQNRQIAVSGPDLETHTFNLDYQFRKQQHIFGLETNLFGRDQQNLDSTEAYRVSVYWTYQFDKPATRVAARTFAPMGVAATEDVSVSAGMSGMLLGASKDSITGALSNAGIVNGVSQGEFIVYEVALLRDVARRQRLAVHYVADTLSKSALIIDFTDVGDRDSLSQTFERVRQSLIRELGTPSRTFDEGAFSPDFVQDVNDQRFIRISEWQTATGTIRFGIPRRLDGQVRMEIQHARTFPPLRDTLWSVEAVR